MRNIIIVFSVFILSINSFGQVGINTTNPHSSAALDIPSIDKGILVPRMTIAQRNLIGSPATGLLIYQLDATPGFYYFNGTSWQSFSSSGWSLNGDGATNPSTNKIGTMDNQDLKVVTNNSEAFRISNTGNVGLGTTTPSTKLHIAKGIGTALTIDDGSQGTNRVLFSDANGLAVWKDLASGVDDDWRWQSGSSNADPIYHIGNVMIGQTTASPYNLQVYNGATSGSKAGLGSIEYVVDGVDEFRFSHSLAPIVDNSINAGSSTKRWTAVYASTGTINTSDRREKTNIQPITYGINEVVKLKPVSFKWKEEWESGFKIPNKNRETKLGFIAQQIQPILPEVVETHQWKEYEESPGVLVKEEMPRLGVSYSEFIPVLIKAVQEQQTQIDNLKLQKVKLEEMLSELNK